MTSSNNSNDALANNINAGFSVLMSLYAKELPENLEMALQSLADQTISATEIIIVLDGPITEELNAVLEKWVNYLPLITVPLEKNVGLGTALNSGLKHCNYDIVARMDTDDICVRERFEKQISFLRLNENVSLVGGAIAEFNCQIYDLHQYRFSAKNHSEILKYARYRNPFNHMTVVFRKSVVEKVGGYIHHHSMEDYNLWLRVLSHGYETYNIPEVMVWARTGNGMISRRRDLNYIKSELKLARLKYYLKLDSYFHSWFVCVLRVLPRLLPVSRLTGVYSLLRKKNVDDTKIS